MTVGVIGLGRMGAPIAGRIADVRGPVIGHDSRSDLVRVPRGVQLTDLATLARTADIVVLSLPDAKVVLGVVDAFVACPDRKASVVVDCSTIGVHGAEDADTALRAAGITYVDAAVSGGVRGAEEGTLTAMCACDEAAFATVESLLATFTSCRTRVGDRPGLGQAAKLANNFLSATALAATSEAIAFGERLGIDPVRLLEVLNTSSGRNTATADKFPRHVLTGSFAAGFSNVMMHKDVALYRESSVDAKTSIGRVVEEIWRAFAGAEPGADITRVHPYLQARTNDPGEPR